MQQTEIIFHAQQLPNGRWEAMSADKNLIVSGWRKKEELMIECRALAKYKYPECQRVIVEFNGEQK